MSAYSESLIDIAMRLVGLDHGRPRRSSLNRGVSTAYYAMFAALCDTYARSLVGQPGSGAPPEAWTMAYRALEHTGARQFFQEAAKTGSYGTEIALFGVAFTKLQDARHGADYDPLFRTSRAEAFLLVEEASNGVLALASAGQGEVKRMAVALLVKSRRR